MSQVTTTIDTYCAIWNETDAARRDALIERVWAADGRYVDPMSETVGPAALSKMVAAVHVQFPGHRIRRVSGVDAHHDQVRFAWELVGPDGAIAVAGIDVGELAADGRLRRIAGFFGPVPALTA